MDYYNFKQILNGNFENIPKEKSKTVRVFLSSTFSDTHAERDYLIEHVYPKLKTYCKTTYGLDFQILDMRWGISSEITNSHLTTTICLNEIRTCQKYSVGPNFVAFLSHRYGMIGLPTRIIKEEYELFANEMNNYEEVLDLTFKYDNSDDAFVVGPSKIVSERPILDVANLFEYCYELDENEIPARYKLKHLDQVIPNFDTKNPIYQTIWNLMETKLGDILKVTAKRLLDKKMIDQTKYERYFVSVTEKEIFNGILNAKNSTNTALFFQRNILDIDQYMDKNLSTVKKYIDLDKNDNIDESSRSLLNELKNVKIPSKLPESNIFKFDVNFDEEHGISLATHEKYLHEFGDTFYAQLKRLIDKSQEQKSEYAYLSEEDVKILQEVLDHAIFCNETVEKFHGRKDLLDKIQQYLLNDLKSPLILHGESGCGKTAILAKITSQILKIVPDPQNYSVILRFLGTSPISSNIINLFNSLIYQLSKLFDMKAPEKPISSKRALKEYLQLQLAFIVERYPSRKIVIVLDSIDQLQSCDYVLDWFLDELPPNVKMIYSTLPNHGGILSTLKKFDRFLPDQNFLEITSLNSELANLIIRDWLKKSKRRISELQAQVLNEMLEKGSLYPLYVKIIFDIISKWSSFYVPNEKFKKANTIDKSIEYLFTELEKTHGKLLFTRSIIYMTSFKNGISENELEDILSLDDEVLFDIFEYHSPPSRRLPSALWSRIKHDLKEYMVEKEIDDTRVIYWYHRRFIEVANSFYISKLNTISRETIFGNVVDFFNETWKNTPKPYKYNEYLKKKLKLETNSAQEIRNTSMQPTVFVDRSGTLRYNKRKISELPSFIANLTANLSIPLSCEHVYFNYHFISGLFVSNSFSEIFGAFELINQRSSYSVNEDASAGYKALKVMSLVFLQCGISMKEFPFSAVTLILYRTLNFYGCSKYFSKLIDEYYQEAMKLSSIVLTNQILPPPGNDLIFQFDKLTAPITCACIGGENDSFVFMLSNKLSMFNMSTVFEQGEIELTKDDAVFKFFLVSFSESEGASEKEALLKDFKGGFVVGTNNELKSYAFDSTLYFTKSFESKTILGMALLSEYHVIVAIEGERALNVYNLKSGEVSYTLNFEQPVKAIECNTHSKALNEFREFSYDKIHLVVFLNDNSMDFYEITADPSVESLLESNALKIVKKKSVPSTGNEIVAFKYLRLNYRKFEYHSYVCSFDNGSLVFGQDLNDDEIVMIPNFVKSTAPKLIPTDNIQDIILFVDKTSGNLALVTQKRETKEECQLIVCEIPGSFDDAVFISETKIAAISLGTITFYLYSTVKNFSDESKMVIKLIRVAEIDAHYDDITFLFSKETMLLTCSKDSFMKVFLLHSNMERRNDYQFDFDRSDKEISYLCSLDDQHVAAKLKSSNHVDIWNVEECKIVNNITVKDKVIRDVLTTKSYIITLVINEHSSEKRELNLKIYSYTDVSKKSSFKEKFSIDIEFDDNYKLFHFDSSELSLHVLTESFSSHKIKLHSIYETVKGDNKSSFKASKCVSIKTTDAFIDSTKSIIQNSCLTTNQDYLALFISPSVFYIDAKSGHVLCSKGFDEKEINLNYFLSPTNLSTSQLTNLTPIPNSNNIIALSNLRDLVLIEFCNSSTSQLNFIYSDQSQNKFDAFKLSPDLNVLLAIDTIKCELVAFDLNVVLRKASFAAKNSVYFKIALSQANQINKFGCNSNFEYIYAIEKRRILKIFTIDDTKKSAKLSGEVPLYSQAIDVVPSGDFISIAMQDRKVISFLIVDGNKPEESKEKICRFKKNADIEPELKKKYEKIIEKNAELLDESSDEDDDLDKIVDDVAKDKNKNKQLTINEIHCEKIVSKKLNLSELKPYWITEKGKSKNNTLDFDRLSIRENESEKQEESRENCNSAVMDLKMELKNQLKNKEKEVRTMNTGKNVKVTNTNSKTTSRACSIQ